MATKVHNYFETTYLFFKKSQNYDTTLPSSPTLSQILYPVATTPTRIKQISWNQPKIHVPLQQ